GGPIGGRDDERRDHPRRHGDARGGGRDARPARPALGAGAGQLGREDALPEPGRRLVRRQSAQRVAGVCDLVPLGAPFGGRREICVDRLTLGGVELAVEIGGEAVVGSQIRVHAVSPAPTRAFRSSRRPRWIRDRTVPTGTPRDSAISSYGRSPTSQSTTAARNSSGSVASAACTSSENPVETSSAAGAGGRTQSGSSGSASAGRRFRRRTSSRNTFVTIRANQPSSDPGWYRSRPLRTRSSDSCTRSCASLSFPARRYATL